MESIKPSSNIKCNIIVIILSFLTLALKRGGGVMDIQFNYKAMLGIQFFFFFFFHNSFHNLLRCKVIIETTHFSYGSFIVTIFIVHQSITIDHMLI
jgi:hypothetical protein